MDYKEILKGIVNIINTSEKSDIGFVNICTYIDENCPELAESEDKRIIREIKQFLKHHNGWIKEWIDWLENQEQKETTLDKDEIIYGIRQDVAMSLINHIDANSKGMCLSNMECEDLENAVINSDWSKVYRYMKKKLEKQGDQKPADKFDSKFTVKYDGIEYDVLETKDIDGVTYYGIEEDPNHIAYVKAENCEIISGHVIKENSSPNPAMLSEQKHAEWHVEDEQNLNACLGYIPDEFLRRWLKDVVHVKYDKSVDKVKPKFKVGDWIIGNEDIFKVTEVCESWYEVVDDKDKHYSIDFSREYMFHLWTIKDAKDGDILVTNRKQPFIFNGHYDEDTGYIHAYCGISDIIKDDSFYFNEECDDCSFNVWCEGENVCPATEEQSNLLFKKMKEAGYDWDFDKKEFI